jgi:hypothetical protein
MSAPCVLPEIGGDFLLIPADPLRRRESNPLAKRVRRQIDGTPDFGENITIAISR